MLLFGMLIGGFCLRIFERPLYSHTQLDFSYYGNAIWCVILTMTTVVLGLFPDFTSWEDYWACDLHLGSSHGLDHGLQRHQHAQFFYF